MRDICLESGFSSDPIRAFTGNGTLCQLVTKPYFKIRAKEVSFPIQFWDIEFPFLFFGLIRIESWRSKDKINTIHLLQLFL